MQIGVDIGGTFTDLVLSDAGRLVIHKRLSTPANPARAMVAGLAAISPDGLAAVRSVSHGSTVATNAILERKGARTALITTAGFKDLLFIGRQDRPDLYALEPRLPPPLVPRDLCFEVPERLDFTGKVDTPLDLRALDEVLACLAEQQVEAIAVCLLYSYINPAHEQAIKARALQRGPWQEQQIALSSEVMPEFREYERASTAVLDAYVRPVMGRYLQRLENELPSSCVLRVMKSDGSVVSAARARAQAIQTALSGPAAGVIGAFHLASLAGYDQIITLDMGGTSTDVALCPGELVRRSDSKIDDLPLRKRVLDIVTIGAGGGSIARLDAGGALRVGPQSAGADPGPVAYGRGGDLVTVSDANLVLGRLDPAHFLGGDMTLHENAARAAVSTLAEQVELSLDAMALGVIDIANVNIDRAVRRVSIARGYDPRAFMLVAFGGAGPLHACEVAESLQMTRVLIPRYPGVLCALGLLVADVMLDYSRAVLQPVDGGTPGYLSQLVEDMTVQARAELTQEGIAGPQIRFTPLLDMRYAGQAYELTIPADFSQDQTAEALAAAFHEQHFASYGHAIPGWEVQVVNVRLEATGIVAKPAILVEPVVANEGANALLGQKQAVYRGGAGMIALYDRERLLPGARFSGPAILFQLDATTFLPPGWSARVDGYRNLILERSP